MSDHEEAALKYLCLVYLDEKKLDTLSKVDRDAIIDESLEYDDLMRKNGHYITSNALQSVRAAATVRPRNGKVLVTDGPFAETREQLGGFILIDARDRDEAIEVAAKVPVARLGGIEIRPVQELRHS